MSTEKVIVICAAMMVLEYLYIKQNIGNLIAQSATSSLTGAAASAANTGIQDLSGIIDGVIGGALIA